MSKPIAIDHLMQRKGILLLHLAFWILHALVLYLIVSKFSVSTGFSLAFTAASILINLVLAYVNLWWLLPSYLLQRAYRSYAIRVLVLILLASFVRTLVLEGVAGIFDPPNVPSLSAKALMSTAMSFLILVLTSPFYLLEGWLEQKEAPEPESKDKEAFNRDYCFVKTDYKLVKLFYRDILYVESLRDLVRIHTAEGNYLSQLSMKKMDDMLPEEQFIRIHRTYIIALGRISSVFGNTVEIGNKKIPIGKTYREAFFKQLEIL